MFRFGIVAAMGFVLLTADSVQAQESRGREHTGFFLQMQYGGSYLEVFDEALSIHGAGAGLNLQIGSSPVENLVIFGEVSAQFAPDPIRNFKGREFDSRTTAVVSITKAGPGIAYYFGPNIFVSGSAGIASVEFEDPELGRSRAVGFGFRLGLGKEWWVSEKWGLGVVGSVFQAHVVDRGFDFTSRSAGLGFSATYQ